MISSHHACLAMVGLAMVVAGEVNAEPAMSCKQILHAYSQPTVTLIAAGRGEGRQQGSEFCRVRGTILPDVGFEAQLPLEWNGRFYMVDNAGSGGRINTRRMADARRMGYATASTDQGYDYATEGDSRYGYIVLTTHTNRHIYKEGAKTRDRIGREYEDSIVPLRALADAGVVAAFGSDNVPPSLFYPIWQAVARRDRETGDVIGESQRLSRLEAPRHATVNAAYVSFDEASKGSLSVGKLADLIVLPENPLTMDLEQLKDVRPDLTIVNGRVVSLPLTLG